MRGRRTMSSRETSLLASIFRSLYQVRRASALPEPGGPRFCLSSPRRRDVTWWSCECVALIWRRDLSGRFHRHRHRRPHLRGRRRPDLPKLPDWRELAAAPGRAGHAYRPVAMRDFVDSNRLLNAKEAPLRLLSMAARRARARSRRSRRMVRYQFDSSQAKVLWTLLRFPAIIAMVACA
ncbi:hypothetical protein ACVI1T_004966 [Rhizobium redzepovicii]